MSVEDDVIKKVAVKIKELRGDMTQKEFASLLGVSPQAVSEWENANKMPRMGIIEKLSVQYNVPKSFILGEVEVESPSEKLSSPNDFFIIDGKTINLDDLTEDAKREYENFLQYFKYKYNL